MKMIAEIEENQVIIIAVLARRTCQAITSLRVATTMTANVIAAQTVDELTKNASDMNTRLTVSRHRNGTNEL